VKSDNSFDMTTEEVLSASQPVEANTYPLSEVSSEFFEKNYSFVYWKT